MANLLEQLAAIVGPSHVLASDADVAGYNVDGRGPVGRALAVVRPRTSDEVVAIAALAARKAVRIVPQGGRTGLVAAGAADDSGTMLLLSLERIATPLDIDPVNRTARVGAGVTLSQLNAAAAEFDLFFPIDLGADPTVGGMISANTGGARFLRYGDVRRNTLAVEIVSMDQDAAIVVLGRDCWKQNDGLDLKQLVIGAGGSLGIVTAATLALQPRPAHAICALLALEDPAGIDRLLVAFEHAWGMLLTAFEGISGPAYEAALAHVPRLRRPFAATHSYYILIELAGGAALDDVRLEEMLVDTVAPFMEGDDRLIADVAIDHRDGLWRLRHAVTEGLRNMGSVIGCDVALRRSDVAAFRSSLIEILVRDHPSLAVCDFGHVGDGGIHFNLVWPHGAGPIPDGLAEQLRLQVLSVAVEQFGGSFSAEHGVGPRNIAAYQALTLPSVRKMASAVQSVFAPVPIGRVDY